MKYEAIGIGATGTSIRPLRRAPCYSPAPKRASLAVVLSTVYRVGLPAMRETRGLSGAKRSEYASARESERLCTVGTSPVNSHSASPRRSGVGDSAPGPHRGNKSVNLIPGDADKSLGLVRLPPQAADANHRLAASLAPPLVPDHDSNTALSESDPFGDVRRRPLSRSTAWHQPPLHPLSRSFRGEPFELIH